MTINKKYMSDPTITIFCSMCTDSLELDMIELAYNHGWTMDGDEAEEELANFGWIITDDGEPLCPKCQEKEQEKEQDNERVRNE